MHLQFHKTLLFPMVRMAYWLADCPDPMWRPGVVFLKTCIIFIHLL